MTQINVIN